MFESLHHTINSSLPRRVAPPCAPISIDNRAPHATKMSNAPAGGVSAAAASGASGTAAAAAVAAAGEEKFDLNELIAQLRANENAKHQYEVLGALGKGKFSTVYRARCGAQTMALKKVQIFEMMDARSREKCLREIKLLQSLNHANIVRYVDSYIDNNELIIVLEFAEGGDLKGCVRISVRVM